MSLQLILGRSGTGKTTYCYENIKKIINNKQKIYIITPEQYSFTAEKSLLDILGTNSVVNAEVLSFNRIAHRVFTEVGGAKKTLLSKCGRNIIIFDILSKNKKKLKFLNNEEKNLDIALNAITELRRQNVRIDDECTGSINEVILQSKDLHLKYKLEDLSLIYKCFQENIQNKYIDETEVLNLLAQKLHESTMFDDTIVFFDEFVGFTEQEYMVMKEILKKAQKVSVCLTIDTNENQICRGELRSPEIYQSSIYADEHSSPLQHATNLFFQTEKTANKLTKLAKENGISIEKPVVLTETYRFKTPELKHLEQNIFNNNLKEYDKNVENIEMFLAFNPYSEAEYVAQNIIKLVRDKGYKYNDIAVMAKNIDSYSNIVKAIFSKYGIPVFIDEKKDLNQNMLSKYVLSILEVISKNWKYEAVFNYLKNPFSGLNMETVYVLEKYCLKWGIKGSKWLKEWKYEDDRTNELEQIRKKIITPILNLKNQIVGVHDCTLQTNARTGTKNFTNITKAIYEFLIKNHVEENINKVIFELEKQNELDLANQYRGIAKVIFDVFDEIVMIFKEEKTTFDKYIEILKMGLKNIDIGTIPASIDNVIVGDIERSKSHKIKIAFVLGLNEGILPSITKDEGFLNDNDREILRQRGVELAGGTLEQIYTEQFYIYKIFTVSEEKLFLTYTSTDKEGQAVRASTLIYMMRKLFKNIKQSSDIITNTMEISVPEATFDSLLINLSKLKNGEEISGNWLVAYEWYKNNSEWNTKLEEALKGLEYSNLSRQLNEINVQKLYGDTLKTSISKLEQYRKCPFSFYIKYGLKLSEQTELDLKPVDTGAFMHEVIDEFFEQVKDIEMRDLEENQIKEIVDKIIEEKLELPKNYIFSSSPKFITLTLKLKRLILKSIEYIVYQFKYSNFKIMGNEVEFKEGKHYPPITLELDDKQKVEISGKIDRVDLAISGNKKYIRIIDYKSSIKDIDLNEVVGGLQIQLLTYLDSITKIEDVLPSGVMYFNLVDPIIKNNKNLTEEQIEEKIKNSFKMQGLLLADVQVVKMMDNRLQAGKSSIVNAEIKQDGTLSERTGNLIKEADFKNLQKEVKKVIRQISSEILKGNIEIKPYKNGQSKACDYCNFSSICGFNTNIKGNGYFRVGKKSKEEVLEGIR
ncbi:MAG: helicase-exonuclease AddAB subunit AddB [Oscillospiraceae bacterium]|nr:helicase-exonuclease AddAB subunit AddB [Oscillospiraceae bacterium]